MIVGVCNSPFGMAIPITERLRNSTRALHTEVERAGVMRRLLRGQLDRAGYCRLLRNLHVIYSALESGLARHSSNPALAALCCEPLFRRDALGDDLNFLYGDDWEEAIAITATATQYAAHLDALTEHAPILLGAHAYVRYLGDLSGGQMLNRIVAKNLSLQPDQGVSFYDFGSAADVAKRATEFRAGLDLMAEDEASARALVDEACVAFTHHKALFEALVDA